MGFIDVIKNRAKANRTSYEVVVQVFCSDNPDFDG